VSTPDGSAESREVYRRYLSAVVLHAQAGAKACGLGATDLYALNILELSGPMTPGELAARTGLTTGPTTRLIDRLAKDGYGVAYPIPTTGARSWWNPSAGPRGWTVRSPPRAVASPN